MQYRIVQLGPGAAGWLLVLLGLWLVLRKLWQPPLWLWPALLTAGALWLYCVYYRQRRQQTMVGACVMGAWATYAWISAYLSGLPWYFWLAFLGLGCFVAYGVLAERPLWPLVPGTLLLGLATIFWILHVSLSLLPVIIPVALIIWGLGLIRQRQGNRN